MYRRMELLKVSHELISWMKAWELLWRRSWRLLRKVMTGLLLFAETVLNGRKLRRTVAPGKYENVENGPSGYYSSFTHPPNLN